MTKLFVSGLPYSTTEDDLSRIFGEYGPLKTCSLITDRVTQQSRGFAFIEFESALDALHAEEALNQSELDGRKIGVSEAQPRRGR